MQFVVRYGGRRLIPAIKPALSQRATLVSGPPKYPMSGMVSMAGDLDQCSCYITCTLTLMMSSCRSCRFKCPNSNIRPVDF